ncbi:hypothetical protein [Micromonospora wenchangensis]|uniref:hypothetical protein n=1 Tax=Micromonospora wenchangensis TaxID=1185415 RepID=UPI00382B6559
MTGPHIVLAHGWTLTDVQALARATVSTHHSQYGPWQDRYDAAHHGILTLLYTAPQPPTRRDLTRAAGRAISVWVRDEWRHHGIDETPGLLTEGRLRPRFVTYWDERRVTPSPEERVVERIALAQVWARMSPAEQRVIAARAAYGDNGSAAEGLGKPRASFVVQLNQARRHFRARWFEGETVRAWANDQPTLTGRGGSVRALKVLRQRRSRRQVAA